MEDKDPRTIALDNMARNGRRSTLKALTVFQTHPTKWMSIENVATMVGLALGTIKKHSVRELFKAQIVERKYIYDEVLEPMALYRLASRDEEKRKGIVCLCGSVRFRQRFDVVACQLSLDDWVVIGPHCWNHAELHSNVGEEKKRSLDELHFRKIEMADLVYVINVKGYIGESTQREIEHAKLLGKPIKYLEPIKE